MRYRDVTSLALLRTIAIFVLVPSWACAADVVISDGTFFDANWSTTVYLSVNGATHSAVQAGSGGNPDEYRDMSHSLPPLSQIGVLHTFLGGTYDPATSGAIISIDYREDQNEFNPPFFGAAIGATAALVQGGVAYYGTSDLSYSNLSWQTRQANGLGPTAFIDSSGAHPDFTAAGAPIQFGFTRSNSNTSPSESFSTHHGIDNWSVTVHTDPTAVAPSFAPTSNPLRVLGPNPFRETVAFAVAATKGIPTVEIYDVEGRFLRSLDARAASAGASELTWDGSDAAGRRTPPGTYFLRLTSSRGDQVTERVTIVR